MAALIKLRNMPVVRKCAWNYLNNVSNRLISTSKKNNDTAATTCPPQECPKKEDWVSYGFDYNDKTEDTNVHHASFFFSVTLCLVLGGFGYAYFPDTHLRDWAQREAFLELRRREKAGLPLVDPNYVNPQSMNLPAESELCEVEIVI